MMFGATCSPSSAIYVKDRNAEEFRQTFASAVFAIQNNHYMDDYLDSTDTEEAALKQIQDVIHVHKAGGFEIRNFICTSTEVLNQIPSELIKNTPEVIQLDKDSFGRVLGVYWNPNSDIFSFSNKFETLNPDLLKGKQRPTKREVLKVVMSVYDPLGFIAQFVITGKILLQKVWQFGVGWDEKIPEILFKVWQQ